MKNATSPLFRNHNRSALPAGTYITHRVIYYSLVTIGFDEIALAKEKNPFTLLHTVSRI